MKWLPVIEDGAKQPDDIVVGQDKPARYGCSAYLDEQTRSY